MNLFLTNLAGVGLRVSVVIVFVALLRPWLRRGIGSRGVALLWSVLAVRLLWPGLPEARWGLIHAAPDRPAAEVAGIIPRSVAGVNAGQRPPRLDALPPAPRSVVLTNAPAPVSRMNTLEWVACLWAAGFCTVAAYFLWHVLAARRWAARTQPADAWPHLAEAFAALPAHVRGELEVRVTRELDTPVLAGWLHPQIWVPTPWVDRLSREELQHILWHEIGHARRRDLPVQWLFAAACCLHWFNPLAWALARWARDERELACDAWVFAQQSEPAGFTTAYGLTLLQLVESVRRRGPWPLAPATVAMAASVGHLRQRLREIAAFRPVPAWRGSVGALAGAAALMALTTVSTVSSAQETAAPTAAAPSTAEMGTITGRVVAEKTGEPLADALVRAAVGEDVDMRKNRYLESGCVETRTDHNGEYHLSVPLSAGKQTVQLDALAPGYRSSAGTYASGGDWASVTLAPSGTGKHDFKLPEALYLKGVVVDEAGQPVRNAEIETTFSTGNSYGYVAETRTAADGQFEVFDFPLQPEANWKDKRLEARHDDYIRTAIDNVYSLGKDEQTHLKLVLAKGRRLTGTLLDAEGKPAAAVEVTARPHGLDELKRSVTDRDGKFVLRGLKTDADYLVTAHALPLKEKYQAKMRTDKDQEELTLHLTPIAPGQPLKPTEVLGMQLVEMTDELCAVYDYSPGTKGALILDPGKDSGRLQIGKLKEGQVFWLVEDIDYKGTTHVARVREFVDAMVKNLRRNEDGTSTCRVVYNEEPGVTNTQYLRVTEAEAADLKALAAKLDAEQPAASPAAAATPGDAAAPTEAAKPDSSGYALQVEGKTVATLLVPPACEMSFVSSEGAAQDKKASTLTLTLMGDVKGTLTPHGETPITITFKDMTLVRQPTEPVDYVTLVLPPGNTRGASTLKGNILTKRTNQATNQDDWLSTATGDATITVPGHAPITISGDKFGLRFPPAAAPAKTNLDFPVAH